MMIARQNTVKTILWAVVGALASVTIARFMNGLGATTGLSDATPWGFWIAFDVMAGVALAAGGFVLAGTVYILHLDRFRQFVRPAVLTAFLGYAAVATGLLYDLGLPWNILHPVMFPQPRSVLFEVAMCVMLYLSVLFLEFSPVILEHQWFGSPLFRRIHEMSTRITIPLVIAGIVLSTLHQSSLGSLFLIAPHRLHPLWYSPIIWILFLVSAIGLGLMMVTLESFLSAWYFGHALRIDLLAKLGNAASFVLLLYAGIRLADLLARGTLNVAFDGSPLSVLFGLELLVSALIPGIMLMIPRIRNSPCGLVIAAVMTVFGVIGYRFNVCIVAFARPEGMSYFPTWMELAVSAGIVAGALLVFIFFVDNLKVYPEQSAEELPQKPMARRRSEMAPRLTGALVAPRRYSLALILGFAVTTAFLPEDAIFGAQPKASPVSRVRIVGGLMTPRPAALGHEITFTGELNPGINQGDAVVLMAIDGNRDGRLVLFPHDKHVEIIKSQRSCGACHHQSLPYRRNSGCSECHRDMYSQTDIFNHEFHVERTDGNRGCGRCHHDPTQVKNRDTATACADCHINTVAKDSLVQPHESAMTGFAPGYMDTMHGVCVDCHEQKVKQAPSAVSKDFFLCMNCHRDVDASQLFRIAPYDSARAVPKVGRKLDGVNGAEWPIPPVKTPRMDSKRDGS